jgi:hypothetical protein
LWLLSPLSLLLLLLLLLLLSLLFFLVVVVAQFMLWPCYVSDSEAPHFMFMTQADTSSRLLLLMMFPV